MVLDAEFFHTFGFVFLWYHFNIAEIRVLDLTVWLGVRPVKAGHGFSCDEQSMK